MGGIINKKKKKKDNPKNDDQTNKLKDEYHEDTNDAANLAIAICNKDESSNIEMHFSCEQLPTMDLLGKTDAVIYVEEEVDGKWVPKGRTEVIPENLNPKFLKYFIFPYNVDKIKKFRLRAFDIDNFDEIEEFIDENNQSKQDYIGSVEFVLRDIMCSSSHNKQLQKPIINEKKLNRGFITIRCNDYDAGGEKILFHLGCTQFQSKNELFIRVSSQIDQRTFQPIHRTENQKNKKSLVLWNEFEIPLSKFGADDKAYCKLEIVEFYKDKPEQVLGEFENTLSYFKENTKKRQRIIINSLFKGEIAFQNVTSVKRISFINYLLSNAQISLITAIDFTNSNKPQTSHDSFHREITEENQDNQYSIALKKLNDILEQFDHDNIIPLFGFGAKLPPFYNVVSNCFALNGNYFNPQINGSDGVVQVYKEKLSYLQFHGPTIFSEAIKFGATYAKAEAVNQKNQKYFILLIVTDSDPNDLDSMIDELVEASAYPISYLIVGLGDNPFPKMQQELKGAGNDFKLYSKKLNKLAERHNYHFFSFNEYCQDYLRLARECMRYLPQQFLQYMDKRGIIPIDTNKNLKTARTDYMHQKIDQHKKRDKQKSQNANSKHPPEQWLTNMKNDFKKRLKELGYLEEDINYLIEYENIPCPDLNLFIEMLSLRKEDRKLQKKLDVQEHNLPKNQVTTRVAIPQKINKVLNRSKSPDREKIGHRVFQVQANNQLDLIMKRKKKEISSTQKSITFTKEVDLLKYFIYYLEKFFNQQIQSRRSLMKKFGEQFLFSKKEEVIEKEDQLDKFQQPTRSPNSENEDSDSDLMANQKQKKNKKGQKKQQVKIRDDEKNEERIESEDEIEPVITIQNSTTKANEALVSHALKNDLNMYFQNTNYCLICNQNQINTVFMPCGHAGYCQSCAHELDDNICPICNRTFQTILNTHFTNKKKNKY